MSDEPTTIPSPDLSEEDKAAVIKDTTEAVMNFLRENVPDSRARSIALTNYEQAAMWAVKASSA